MDLAVNIVGIGARTPEETPIFRVFTIGIRAAWRCLVFKREVSSMRTLVIGLVIAIVFLATYFVSNMDRIW